MAYADGLAVFGWSDTPCPPATDAARLLVAVEATGEAFLVAAGVEGTLRLEGEAPAWSYAFQEVLRRSAWP